MSQDLVIQFSLNGFRVEKLCTPSSDDANIMPDAIYVDRSAEIASIGYLTME
jgi:hypothetical protein